MRSHLGRVTFLLFPVVSKTYADPSTHLYQLPGPEVALRWLVNSSTMVPSLWTGCSNVPLGITHFREPIAPGLANSLVSPQWAEAYHRIAMVRRRNGRVRFPAWERPGEVVLDIREFAELLGLASSIVR